MKRLVCLAWLVLSCFPYRAGEAADAKIEVVVGGLTNPSGVAVQPDTGHVFVSDSGAGRVVRIVDGKLEEVIVGSPLDVYGKGPAYEIGPLGLAFLDKDTLAVGDGGLKDGAELVRVFAIPAPGQAALKYDDAKFKLGPLADSGAAQGEGNLFGVAVSKTALFVTCNGDDTKGWVAKADLVGGKPGELRRFIATKAAVQVDAPAAITIGARGEIVVGQMGKIDVPQDSLLSFYNATTGKLLLSQRTGLYDLTGLAYSPRSQQLFALDFAWMKPEAGGLFQLVAGRQDDQPVLAARRIANLDKPSAMAFAPDGSLYVAVFGTAQEGAGKPGKLLKITL